MVLASIQLMNITHDTSNEYSIDKQIKRYAYSFISSVLVYIDTIYRSNFKDYEMEKIDMSWYELGIFTFPCCFRFNL